MRSALWLAAVLCVGAACDSEKPVARPAIKEVARPPVTPAAGKAAPIEADQVPIWDDTTSPLSKTRNHIEIAQYEAIKLANEESLFLVDPYYRGDARRHTQLVGITGSVTEESDEEWVISLNLGGAKHAFRAKPPKSWDSPFTSGWDPSDFKQLRWKVRTLRLDLGETSRGPAWLRFDGRATVYLVVEGPDEPSIADVTALLTNLPVGDFQGSATYAQTWEDGRWTPEGREPTIVGDLRVRGVSGTLEILDSTDSIIARPEAPTKSPSNGGWSDDGCLSNSARFWLRNGRVEALVSEYTVVDGCDWDDNDSLLESASQQWMRKKDGSFQLRAAEWQVPQSSKPRAWLGDELEWRLTYLRHNIESAHDVEDEDYRSRWEVRPIGGKWSTMGGALFRRYSEALFIDGE